VSAWDAGGVSISACPGTTLVSAVPTGNTTVTLTFSSALDAASVLANGSQFTLDNGGVVTAAAASGSTVTLTVNALADGDYTVTVGAGVLDAGGAAVSGSAGFSIGAAPLLTLEITEIDYDQTGTDTAEFIELHNFGAADIDLAGFEIVVLNQAGTVQGTPTALTGTLAGGARLFFGAAGGAAGALATMQNGPDDAVALIGNGALIDGVVYAATAANATLNFTVGATTYTIDEATVNEDPVAGTLCRVTPQAAFTECATPTPGT
jgi:hypothetical protein